MRGNFNQLSTETFTIIFLPCQMTIVKWKKMNKQLLTQVVYFKFNVHCDSQYKRSAPTVSGHIINQNASSIVLKRFKWFPQVVGKHVQELQSSYELQSITRYQCIIYPMLVESYSESLANSQTTRRVTVEQCV